ncbi:MAG: aminotransferase class IV [Peptococcaceae bacterium]|nr:aminotransferase class IV [Peptococcaceae bacterium]
MDFIACVNGDFVEYRQALVPAADRGFLYGYGLFETILVRAGRPELLTRHVRRLAGGCRRLALPLVFSVERLAALVEETVERNGLREGAARLTWSAGPREGAGNLVITVRPLPYGPDDYERGFTVALSGSPRNEKSFLTGLKTLNYLENLLAREKARREGRDEVLFLNTAGALAETSAANIFLVRGNRLVTPAADQGLLPGIMRGLVLELAGEAGLGPEERPVGLRELSTADEVFLTNSLLGVMPVVEAAGQRLAGPGKLTARLGRLVEEACRGTREDDGQSRLY